ncbi:acetyl-CoA acetyltransferase [Sagittula stellata E-37]|uniref:Acetyl-CoA acetyltransferase n=1 Tax=Sagittula stellata (strain ATCC 700073 / DSM 11524 / E-37) TaxID=388399 RepID=A3K8C7_SAGS3|nr:acetyl-CoA acetyltransferase [Sagittula stellata E-37]
MLGAAGRHGGGSRGFPGDLAGTFPLAAVVKNSNKTTMKGRVS